MCIGKTKVLKKFPRNWSYIEYLYGVTIGTRALGLSARKYSAVWGVVELHLAPEYKDIKKQV